MKKSSQNAKTHTTSEVKRYLGALQEENRGHYKAIGKRLDGINEKLDSHGQKLDSHTEMIGQLNVRMTSIELKITEIERDILVMKKDIMFIKSGIKRKVDQEEFDALIRRVSVLEKRIMK